MPINANHILISIHKNTVECNLAYREHLEELNSASMHASSLPQSYFFTWAFAWIGPCGCWEWADAFIIDDWVLFQIKSRHGVSDLWLVVACVWSPYWYMYIFYPYLAEDAAQEYTKQLLHSEPPSQLTMHFYLCLFSRKVAFRPKQFHQKITLWYRRKKAFKKFPLQWMDMIYTFLTFRWKNVLPNHTK